jgi:DnaK suppressor protein
MDIDIDTLKKRLLEKEAELSASIARLEAEARDSPEDEPEDLADTAVSSEGKETAFRESSIEFQMLKEVRDALRRMEDGTYGRCIDCGREIAPARLEAVPWTPYCREDQEKHDKEQREKEQRIEDRPATR